MMQKAKLANSVAKLLFTEKYSPLFYFRPCCQRVNLRLGDFTDVSNNLSLNTSVSGRIQNGVKLFTSVEGRKLHGSKITQYTIYPGEDTENKHLSTF